MTGHNKILVFGLGSNILSDAGIGLRIVDWLTLHCDHPNIFYKKAPLFTIEFLFSMQGFDKVFFIDCNVSKTKKPGDFEFYSLKNFRPSLHVSNIHDHAITEILDVSEKTEIKITDDIQFINIEVDNVNIFGERLSPELEKNFRHIAEQIKAIIIRSVRTSKYPKKPEYHETF